MSATDLQIHGPKVLFSENSETLGQDMEKSAAPDLKSAFTQSAQTGTTTQEMGMEQAINPAEPIRIEPEQKIQQAIDPREITTRAEMTGQFLQDMKMGVQVQPGMKSNDSIFGVACNTVSNEVQGISQSLSGMGPDMAGMDPRMLQSLQLQQQFTMKPSSLF